MSMKIMKMDNLGSIIASLILISTMVTPTNIVVFGSTQPRILYCYPESEDRDAPTVFEPGEEHEIYAYVQEAEGVNISQVKVEIYALESTRFLRLFSNWDVTWYQSTTYDPEVGRPSFLNPLAKTTWPELNCKYDWRTDEIEKHMDMAAFRAIGQIELGSADGVYFEMVSDGGMQVRVDGWLLNALNKWFVQGPWTGVGGIYLNAGIHEVEMLHKEGGTHFELKIYAVGGSVKETIQLSRGERGHDPEGRPFTKYSGTWTVQRELGQIFIFDWVLEGEGGILDKRTTYVRKFYVPVDGYFTINNEVIHNSTLEVSKPLVEIWFYSKSRGDEVSSVIVEVSDSSGLLTDLNGRITLNEIERDRVWYGSCTLPRDGEFGVQGSFQSVRGGEWVKMSAVLRYKSELSPMQIRFLINGATIVIILVVGHSIFYLIRKLAGFKLDKERLVTFCLL